MQIVFITGHRKSGTTMLASLFDDHNDFAVYPTDLSLMYAYYPFFNNSKYNYKKKINRIKKILKLSLQKNLNYRIKKESINIELFINSFLSGINKKNINNIKSLIDLLKIKFTSFYNIKKKKYFVLKETSADIYFNKIFTKNDRNKFIHIIRDPRDNYASLKSGQKSYYSNIGEDNLTILSSLINRAKLDFQFINHNKKIYGSHNYLTVKYEDLVSNPEKVMKRISKFLKESFDKKMLAPSIFGLKILSNTFSKKKTTIINSNSKKRWEKELTKSEIDIINYFFKDELKQYYNFKYSKIDYSNITNYYTRINKKFYFNDSFK